MEPVSDVINNKKNNIINNKKNVINNVLSAKDTVLEFVF